MPNLQLIEVTWGALGCHIQPQHHYILYIINMNLKLRFDGVSIIVMHAHSYDI